MALQTKTLLRRRTIPLAAAIGVSIIYLTYLWQFGDTAHWGMSVIFGAAIFTLLQDKPAIAARPSPAAVGLGAVILVALVALSLPWSTNEIYVRMMPLVGGVGVALLAAGFGGLTIYRQELVLLFFLSVPRVIFSLVQDISPITARFSAVLLWYIGYDPEVEGVFLTLQERTVRVWEGCSGAESICYMIGIAVVCLTLYPMAGRLLQSLSVAIAAVLGFLVNAMRVALMAILVMRGNMDGFIFWHEGTGSLVFGGASVALFGLLYWLALKPLSPQSSQG